MKEKAFFSRGQHNKVAIAYDRFSREVEGIERKQN